VRLTAPLEPFDRALPDHSQAEPGDGLFRHHRSDKAVQICHLFRGVGCFGQISQNSSMARIAVDDRPPSFRVIQAVSGANQDFPERSATSCRTVSSRETIPC
jgi:hypothetical protein